MLGEALALSTAILWALTPVFSKKALRYATAVELSLVRSISGSLTLILILPVLRGGLIFQLDIYGFLLLLAATAIGIGVGDTVFFKGIDAIGVSRGVAVSSVHPLIVLLISASILSESITLVNVIGGVLVVSASIVVALSGEESKGGSNQYIEGIVLSLASALLWSIAVTFVSIGVRSVDPLIGNAYRFLILALAMLPTCRRSIHKLRDSRLLLWGSLSGLTGLSLGTTLYLESIRLIGAGKATVITGIQPIISALAAGLSLRERLNMRIWIAVLLASIGIILLEL
ncbi:MAG: DMT family transporter [Candidatus Bathyarchaeia archaeon]